MNRLRVFFSLCMLSFIISVRLLGYTCFYHQVENESIQNLNDQLVKVFSQPNRWGYVFSDYPNMSQNGLTYWLEGWIELPNARCSTIEEAEELYASLYEDFYWKMASVRAIRPFLAEFPLTPTSLCLNVYFRDSNGGFIISPNISSLTLWKDTISFNKYREANPTRMRDDFKTFTEKSAHDVPGLKEFYLPRIPRGVPKQKALIPSYSTSPPNYSSNVGKAVFEFAINFCRKNALSLDMIGVVGEHYHDSRHFDFALRGSQSLKLDEARRLAAKCSNELFDFVRKDRRCLEYIKERSTWTHGKYPSPTPIPEQLAFRITFWDENVDRPLAPNIAQIWLLDGKLRYYTADENQRLVLVHEETFDDAVSSLTQALQH